MSISEPKPYFTRKFARNQDISLDEALDALEAVLRNSVEAHLAADVEVGLTLSGGLDSSLLALLSREYQSRSFSFTVAGNEQHPDFLQAQSVAQMIGSSHQSVIMNFDEYLAAIPGYATVTEIPSSLSALPVYLLCSQIAQRVKACLLGVGADKLCGEYVEEHDRESKFEDVRKRVLLVKQLGVLPSDRVRDQIEHLAPSTPFDKYLQSTFEMNLGDELEQHHLNVYDKCGMAAGVEMRAPYLDNDVVELISQIPHQYLVRRDLGINKYILRHLCLRRFGYDVTDIVLRQKRGFPSSGRSLLRRFDRLCDEVLPGDYLTRHELGNFFKRKRELLMFELFHEIFMVRRGDGQAIGNILDFMRSR